MNEVISSFFAKHRKTSLPLLVGFSGGQDSLSLVHALLSLQIPLHLAYFDDGWRKEAVEEIERFHIFAEGKGLSFHGGRSRTKERSELLSREERYAFFAEIWETKGPFEALILGHHQKDQAETVLKRVLEGAGLFALKGMEEVSYRGGMVVWRPLLKVKKEKILFYIKEHSLVPVDDETNRERRFLRARLRQEILPQLEVSFGKQIQTSLCRLAVYAEELEKYFHKYVSSLPVFSGPWGVFVDLQFEKEPFLRRYHLLQFFKREEITISFEIMERILGSLALNKANYRLSIKEGMILVDRGVLFLFRCFLPPFKERIFLKEGKMESKEGWQIRVTEVEEAKREFRGWKEAWQGKISLPLPIEKGKLVDCFLAPPPPNRELRKDWNEKKIPAIFREVFPLVYQGKNRIADFLCPHSKISSSYVLEMEMKNFADVLKLNGMVSSKKHR